jgi:cold shock CspA family protein
LGAAPIEAEETVKTGIVTFLSEKGYGFITEDKTKENIFFHNNCIDQIKKGNKVSFGKISERFFCNGDQIGKINITIIIK